MQVTGFLRSDWVDGGPRGCCTLLLHLILRVSANASHVAVEL